MVDNMLKRFDKQLRKKYARMMAGLTAEQAHDTAIIGTEEGYFPPDDVKTKCDSCSKELWIRSWLRDLMDKHGISKIMCIQCAEKNHPKDVREALIGGGTNVKNDRSREYVT